MPIYNKIPIKKSLKWEKFIAYRYLVSKKRDGFLSVIAAFSFLGICIGVAVLIIVMSVMGGFREELLSRIIGMKGHVIVHGISSNIREDEAIVKEIQVCDGVVSVCPMIEQHAVISTQDQTRGAVILAMTADVLKKRQLIFDGLKIADLSNFSENTVIIGKRMAEVMFIDIGNSISIINPQGKITPFGMVPLQQEFKVVGTFEVGMTEYDKNVILMPLKKAQSFFDLKQKLTQIEIFTEKIEKNDEIVGKINKIVQKENLRAIGWKFGDSSFFQALQIERNVMFLILTLIILIASFNIISGLIMLVKDKTSDIAIMKTMGASQESILRIFLITGATIGILGTILGIILGIIATKNLNTIIAFIQSLFKVQLFNPEIYFLINFPTKLDYSEVCFISLLTIILSILATIYPSLRAAKLDPVEALRKGA
ncbi:MAG: lipoprotein-releasing ABC transporter permease subunit [Holosporales bacterium]|jgi:lipoprotein-releasing system permease protein|nr:lipoprotein-releasing ABC transporter permease subunit [Holosporales bacterium]